MFVFTSNQKISSPAKSAGHILYIYPYFAGELVINSTISGTGGLVGKDVWYNFFSADC
jgi:hypothetical protein